MTRTRSQIVLALTYAAMVVGIIGSGVRFAGGRASALTAANNLHACSRLAAEIEDLKATPAQAMLHKQSDRDMALCIEHAAETAQIEASGLRRIDPQPSRRLEDSSYLEQATAIELHQVTMRQLVKFLMEIDAGDAACRVTAIRLNAPRTPSGADSEETWSAEITLTHLVFSP